MPGLFHTVCSGVAPLAIVLVNMATAPTIRVAPESADLEVICRVLREAALDAAVVQIYAFVPNNRGDGQWKFTGYLERRVPRS